MFAKPANASIASWSPQMRWCPYAWRAQSAARRSSWLKKSGESVVRWDGSSKYGRTADPARLPPMNTAAARRQTARRGSQSRFRLTLLTRRDHRPVEAPAIRMSVAAANGPMIRFVYSPIRRVTKLKPVETNGSVTMTMIAATTPLATANECSRELRKRYRLTRPSSKTMSTDAASQAISSGANVLPRLALGPEGGKFSGVVRSEEHTSELQSRV